MTVNATVGRRVATATAGQTDFTFNFTIKDASDISVYQRGASDTPSSADLLTLTTDYTVTITGDTGGTVTLNTGATLNDVIVIMLDKNYSRAADYTSQKEYTADNLNADLDNNLNAQKQNDMRWIELTPHYYESSSLTETRDLKLPVLGAGQAWRMNSAGTAITSYTTPEDDPGAAVLRSDLAASTGASLVGTDDGYSTVNLSLDAAHERGPKYLVDSGSANTIVVTTSPADTSYATGELLIVKAAANNTGATTINKNALGAKSVVLYTGGALSSGDITANQLLYLVYDGTNYILTQNSEISEESAWPPAHKERLKISNDVTDPSHDIVFAPGTIRDQDNTVNINFSSQLTKQIDANWAQGDNMGGFPSGLTLSSSTTYHCFVIADGSGNIDAGFDTSLNATNLLADTSGWTKYRRVGSIRTDSSSNILGFTQAGNYFEYTDQQTANAQTITLATTTGTLSSLIPSGRVFEAWIRLSNSGVSAGHVRISSLAATPSTPSADNATMLLVDGSQAKAHVLTNTSGQFRYGINLSSGSGTLYVYSQGWWDDFID